MAYPRSYPFLRLPRTSFQSCKHTSLSASTCFASRSSLPRFVARLGLSLGVLHLVSATAPLRFWLRTRLLLVALASSVTRSLSNTTQFPRRGLSHLHRPTLTPASSLLYALPLLMLLAIFRFKLCGVRSRRRVLICQMMRKPMLLLTTWLDATEMLRSIPLLVSDGPCGNHL
jgi:hypothetical protein